MSNPTMFPQKFERSLEIDRSDDNGDSSELLPVVQSLKALTGIDENIIDLKYYNSFNFSKLASILKSSVKIIGVTSANKSDGKTLVATNMAVSLATGYRQNTLLVDMNFKNPNLHTIFGTTQLPGLTEAIHNQEIRVVPTGIKQLYLMTAGDSANPPGIEQTLYLRQILLSLRKEFDFIIIDMGSIHPVKEFPIHFINEIDGLIGVIDSRKTKKAAFMRMFKHLDESQFIAYVFNRVEPS